MSDKWCCQVWEELVSELHELKFAELDKLIQSGLPKSALSLVFKTLNRMNTYCPCCGSGLTEEAKTVKPPRKVVTEVPSENKKPTSSIRCPNCKGAGNKGEDEKGIPYNCARCLGTGKLDSSNTLKKINPDTTLKTMDLSNKLLKDQHEGRRLPDPKELRGDI